MKWAQSVSLGGSATGAGLDESLHSRRLAGEGEIGLEPALRPQHNRASVAAANCNLMRWEAQQ
jgi:hypothetical protein